MCRGHEHEHRRCRCCDPETRRAERRERRMRGRGFEGEVDVEFAAATVGERAARADEHAEAAFDPSPTVRASAARGPLTDETEGVLAGDEVSRVRAALAGNPNCSPETLATLSMDDDQAVRVVVARHRSTPPETLAVMTGELHRRKDLGIARALAGNPRTPLEALETMAQTGTGGWKAMARRALRDRAKQAAEAGADALLDGTERAGADMDAVRMATAGAVDDLLGLKVG